MEHKLTMLSRFEREERDDGVRLQGHEARYMHKTRMSIIRGDKAGDGFEYDACYQIHVDAESGVMLNTTQGDDLQLEADVRVGMARVLQITKAVGKTAQPRWSVRKQVIGPPLYGDCPCMVTTQIWYLPKYGNNPNPH